MRFTVANACLMAHKNECVSHRKLKTVYRKRYGFKTTLINPFSFSYKR
jgi:hypothetical protein